MRNAKKKGMPGFGLQVWFRIQYIVMLLIAAAGYLFYQNFMFFACMVVLVLLPVYSYYAAKKMIKSLTFSLSFLHPVAEKNTMQEVTLSVRNDSFFPSGNVFYHMQVYNAYYPNEEDYYVNLPVHAKKTVHASWEITASYCGALKVRLTECFVRDMCNLWTFHLPEEKVAELFVMPKKQEVSIGVEDIAGGEGENEEETEVKKGDDPSLLLDIRPYIPGDRMQRVHWKLTARQGDLMVKEYGMSVNKQIHILLELYSKEAAKGMIEAAITGFFNVGMTLLEENERFMACWWNADIRQLETAWVSAEDELYEVLWRIYLCEPYQEEGMALEQYYYEYAKGSAMLCYFALENECVKSGGDILCHFQDEVVMACI